MRVRQRLILGIVLAWPWCGSWSSGDEFHLRSGGIVRGRWENRSPAEQAYSITTEQGIRLRLRAEDVVESVSNSTAQREYLRIAPTHRETVVEQWRLAQWCREHGLTRAREVHLRRILRLDPDHLDARRALGYRFLDGRWITAAQFDARNGYHRRGGRAVTSQELDLLREKQQRESKQRNWLAQLRRWRSQIPGDSAATAAESIGGIRDPNAVKALWRLLSQESIPAVRVLYVEALGEMGTREASQILVRQSLLDRDTEVFYACLDHLVPAKHPEVVDAFVQALRDPDNLRVNRAAVALRKLNDQTAISPLIDALITTHRLNPAGTRSPQSITTTFASPSMAEPSPLGAGLSLGRGAEAIYCRIQNQEVLAALVQLSGTRSFGFNQRAWRYWHAVESGKTASLDTRRNE